ncbi:hypothetical protein PENTCL1PPCAC_8820 [Pristionchus entomophagus]|uniref:DUF4781 domain-containing protein n=1 Tax=Pristionchus entomophagus TaxID=358040 RepID=A0AAV5SU98_9BILA|nr:hypothetical protein PENTCL1PPCAC_8820 [Pristionchus entomophagus]
MGGIWSRPWNPGAKHWTDRCRRPQKDYTDGNDGAQFDRMDGVEEKKNCRRESPTCNLSSHGAAMVDIIVIVIGIAGTKGTMLAYFPDNHPISGINELMEAIVHDCRVFAGCVASFAVTYLWGMVRSLQRLNNKRKHGDSLTDVDSLSLWLTCASSSAGIIQLYLRLHSSPSNAHEIMLNISFVLHFCTLASGTINIVQKISSQTKRRSLTTLDIFKFSSAAIVFSNFLFMIRYASPLPTFLTY